jgi:3-deoxy-D-manno-octulosonic-acid transferase
MRYLLNLVYLALIAVLSPWLAYHAVTAGKYREGFGAKFFGLVPRREGDRPCLWLHAVSVGEMNLLATFLKEFSQSHPSWECVISTTTATGMALARKKYPKHLIFYCPLDFTWAVSAAIGRIRPSCLVLTELELWPNLIRAADVSGARVAIINGRLGARSFRGYRRLRWLVRPSFECVSLVAAQTNEYAERFLALGATRRSVHVTGSMKFDGAQMDRDNPATRQLAALAGFAPNNVIFLAGSTQEPEEQLALDAFRRLSRRHPNLRLVLVPRHPERFDAVARMLSDSGVGWQRRSALASPSAPSTPNPDSRPPTPASPPVLLVDAVGELGAWWGTASIAFVGGSLGRRGGQNMIEPAAYGAAVSFGPNTWNFRDIVAMLLEAEAAVVVNDGNELESFVARVLDDADFARSLGERARQLVTTQVGATRRTVAHLAPLLAAYERVDSRAA